MNFSINNLPKFKDEAEKRRFFSYVSMSINSMLYEKYKISNGDMYFDIEAGEKNKAAPKDSSSSENNCEAENMPVISLEEPRFTFDQLIVDSEVMEELQYVIKFEAVREKVYNKWGLSTFEKSPKQALNFWGDSGTGKTMAAEALANVMGKKIIPASYADIESKYHGDGPKNARRLFQFATENNAVLFIDEADSLLSQRINATQGAEQAANSLRSELLIQIEKFPGIVIFATNLASNYDNAFLTRIKSIHFKKPDQELRCKLWEKMLFDENVHLEFEDKNSIDIKKLAEIGDVCGRDIKNAVIKSAVKVAIDGTDKITQTLLEETIKNIVESNRKVSGKLSEEENEEISKKIQMKLRRDRRRITNTSRKQKNGT